MEKIYRQIIGGIQKKFRESGFNAAVIGLSGGVDSAVTCVLLSRTPDIQNVYPVFLPSKFTSEQSVQDARKIAENLSLELIELPIDRIYDLYTEELDKYFRTGKKTGIPEENLQARIRGNILMYIANMNHSLVIAPGNRSEILTGYCTLYGDTVGSLAPIGELYKTEVYKMAEWLNDNVGNFIPESVIEKPPSAELNANQKDEDDLFPYRILDPILYLYADKGKSTEEIMEEGYDEETVRAVIRRVKKYQFKRSQLPPVVEINGKTED